jgi:hypothetical protein
VNQKIPGFRNTMKILSVPVTSSLTLEAGTFGEGGDALTILPPSVSMFDQLLDWLSRQTPPDQAGFSTATIGIGATALCLGNSLGNIAAIDYTWLVIRKICCRFTKNWPKRNPCATKRRIIGLSPIKPGGALNLRGAQEE